MFYEFGENIYDVNSMFSHIIIRLDCVTMFMHVNCYVFAYLYAIVLWLFFSPFCCFIILYEALQIVLEVFVVKFGLHSFVGLLVSALSRNTGVGECICC